MTQTKRTYLENTNERRKRIKRELMAVSPRCSCCNVLLIPGTQTNPHLIGNDRLSCGDCVPDVRAEAAKAGCRVRGARALRMASETDVGYGLTDAGRVHLAKLEAEGGLN